MAKINLQIAVKDKSNIPDKLFLKQCVDLVLDDLPKNTEITLRVVDEAEMIELNHTYRQKNSATNVLSFPAELPDDIQLNYLGDVVICQSVMEQESCEQQKSLKSHWAHLFIHGILHLRGYDHVEEDDAVEMETLEIDLLKQLGFANPYISMEKK